MHCCHLVGVNNLEVFFVVSRRRCGDRIVAVLADPLDDPILVHLFADLVDAQGFGFVEKNRPVGEYIDYTR